MRHAPTPLPFMKMHGLGNDFVVIDRRDADFDLGGGLIRALADRRRGIGCDQVVAIDPAEDAAAALAFWNTDGSVSATCGNATRCVARWLMDEAGTDRLTLRTARGHLDCEDRRGIVAVNMGAPITDWQRIPLARKVDVNRLPLGGRPVATSMGNPHCTFFVADAATARLKDYAVYETDALFPERTNVQVASVIGPDRLRVRVWERGAGETPASGSSACAVAVAAVRRGLTGRRVAVVLDGGTIEVEWRDDGVWMAGETAFVARGEWLG